MSGTIIAPRWGAFGGDGVTQAVGLGSGITDLRPGVTVRLSRVRASTRDELTGPL